MRAKLVRDRCGAVVDGECFPANSVAGKHMALLLKLYEETEEIARDAGCAEEYADLLEVMLELARLNGVGWDSIEKCIVEKRALVGGFRRGMIWSVDVPNLDPW